MPAAPPEATANPCAMRSLANFSAKSTASRVGLRVPTIATIGRVGIKPQRWSIRGGQGSSLTHGGSRDSVRGVGTIGAQEDYRQLRTGVVEIRQVREQDAESVQEPTRRANLTGALPILVTGLAACPVRDNPRTCE